MKYTDINEALAANDPKPAETYTRHTTRWIAGLALLGAVTSGLSLAYVQVLDSTASREPTDLELGELYGG